MAGNIVNPHLFINDVGPENLSLLDTNYAAAYAGLNSLNNFANYYVDTGAVNALAVTVTVNQSVALTDGLIIQLQVANTTTSTTPTLNVNGLGAKTIVTAVNTALPVGALVGDQYAELIYDGTNQVWRLLSAAAVTDVLAPSGTALLPGLTFASDDTTGLYLPAAGQLGFAVGGVLRGLINSNGAWQIDAPTGSSAALLVYGVSGEEALYLQGSSVVGGSLGAVIQAGSSSADFSLRSELYNGTVTFELLGDGEGFIYAPGAYTTPPTNCFQVGYLESPINVQNVNYGFLISDRGKTVLKSSSASPIWTIPANASVGFPLGTIIRLSNNGANAVTLEITSDTLYWNPTGATGSRSIAQYGYGELQKIGATSWTLWGVGIT